jgi:hypothetical protein
VAEADSRCGNQETGENQLPPTCLVLCRRYAQLAISDIYQSGHQPTLFMEEEFDDWPDFQDFRHEQNMSIRLFRKSRETVYWQS